MKKYIKKCGCGECNNSLEIQYSADYLLSREGDLKKLDILSLNTVYFSIETEETKKNPPAQSVRIHPSDIPTLIDYLKKIKKEHDFVKRELKKQGKLEESIQNNKANLSAGKDFDYSRFEIEGPVKLAKEINETAKLNKKQ